MTVTAANFLPFIDAARALGSHDGPALLVDWYYGRKIEDPVELAEAVPYAWSAAHLPFGALDAETWIELFRAAGYTIDGTRAERPAEPITLYRAAEPRFVHRLAWTASLDVAGRFLSINKARYGNKPRYIYTVTVPPDRLLAHITDREEDEYVTDTRGLRATRVSEAFLAEHGFAVAA